MFRSSQFPKISGAIASTPRLICFDEVSCAFHDLATHLHLGSLLLLVLLDATARSADLRFARNDGQAAIHPDESLSQQSDNTLLAEVQIGIRHHSGSAFGHVALLLLLQGQIDAMSRC